MGCEAGRMGGWDTCQDYQKKHQNGCDAPFTNPQSCLPEKASGEFAAAVGRNVGPTAPQIHGPFSADNSSRRVHACCRVSVCGHRLSVCCLPCLQQSLRNTPLSVLGGAACIRTPNTHTHTYASEGMWLRRFLLSHVCYCSLFRLPEQHTFPSLCVCVCMCLWCTSPHASTSRRRHGHAHAKVSPRRSHSHDHWKATNHPALPKPRSCRGTVAHIHTGARPHTDGSFCRFHITSAPSPLSVIFFLLVFAIVPPSSLSLSSGDT